MSTVHAALASTWTSLCHDSTDDYRRDSSSRRYTRCGKYSCCLNDGNNKCTHPAPSEASACGDDMEFPVYDDSGSNGGGTGSSKGPTIPKRLHFIWTKLVSKHIMKKQKEIPLPIAQARNVQEWYRLHGEENGWEIRFWTYRRIREILPPELGEFLDEIPVGAWISDVLRYYILYRYGGVYVDTDVYPIRRLDGLLNRINHAPPGAPGDGYEEGGYRDGPAGYRGFAVCSGPFAPLSYYGLWWKRSNCSNVGTTVIGASPGDPTMGYLATSAIERTKIALRYIRRIQTLNPKEVYVSARHFALYITGPSFITYSLKFLRYPYNILSSHSFFPYMNIPHSMLRKRPNVFGKHRFVNTWNSSKHNKQQNNSKQILKQNEINLQTALVKRFSRMNNNKVGNVSAEILNERHRLRFQRVAQTIELGDQYVSKFIQLQHATTATTSKVNSSKTDGSSGVATRGVKSTLRAKRLRNKSHDLSILVLDLKKEALEDLEALRTLDHQRGAGGDVSNSHELDFHRQQRVRSEAVVMAADNLLNKLRMVIVD